MKIINLIPCLFIAVATSLPVKANLVAHFPMDVKSGEIIEQISGDRFTVQGNFTPENLPGAEGMALRFDGYTSHIDAALGDIIPAGSKSMTVSFWTAIESYPIIQLDVNTQEKSPIISCLDEEKKTGFGFFVGFDGKYSFKTYVSGWPVSIEVSEPLPTYQWNNLTAVIDGESRSLRLYNNGVEVGVTRFNGNICMTPGSFTFGQGLESRYLGPFELISFNGLIDDVKIWDEVISESVIAGWEPENPANLNIPASRFANQLLRPRFHGMPAGAWTNECHGMYYSEGRYHLFFQKNADGPYMARLHWGHISSANLYDWREEKIALAPGEPYDIKGCWSGCVFSDEKLTSGKPEILYTAVDYEKATIAKATTTDPALVSWIKSDDNPIINGHPVGLSDDFRDPYFFRNGDNAYIIVGTSKDGKGAVTLHRYNEASSSWSNDGDIFFSAQSKSRDGRFWEMPSITPMGDKWLFAVTPLETSTGVKTLYWTGGIDNDGHLKPMSGFDNPRQIELISREGFGLLSPTVYNHDGRTIALGIVPDKLSANDNWELGWAHCYSLPREWSLDANGALLQKPCRELAGMRSEISYSQSGITLDGVRSLAPVNGRSVEIEAVFEVGDVPFGFNLFKNSTGEAKIIYNPSTAELVADFSSLNRLVNDNGVFDGVYRGVLPETPSRGSELKLNIFVDHSIIDIFVNDKWATSIRVFPTDADADEIEVVSNGMTIVKNLKAWNLSPEGSASLWNIEDVVNGKFQDTGVYNIQGMRIAEIENNTEEVCDGLSKGIYIINGKKMYVGR